MRFGGRVSVVEDDATAFALEVEQGPGYFIIIIILLLYLILLLLLLL